MDLHCRSYLFNENNCLTISLFNLSRNGPALGVVCERKSCSIFIVKLVRWKRSIYEELYKSVRVIFWIYLDVISMELGIFSWNCNSNVMCCPLPLNNIILLPGMQLWTKLKRCKLITQTAVKPKKWFLS